MADKAACALLIAAHISGILDGLTPEEIDKIPQVDQSWLRQELMTGIFRVVGKPTVKAPSMRC